jgi:hypothetical protein
MSRISDITITSSRMLALGTSMLAINKRSNGQITLETEELIENWTLFTQELELVRNKVRGNQTKVSRTTD